MPSTISQLAAVPPFREVEIVYDPLVVGAVLAVAAVLLALVAAGMRRRQPRLARFVGGLGPAALITWGAWEGLASWLGMDSIAAFFALMAVAVGLGVALGWWAMAAPAPPETAATSEPAP